MSFANLSLLVTVVIVVALFCAGALVFWQQRHDANAESMFASERLRKRFLLNFYPRLRLWQAGLLGIALVLMAVLTMNPSWGHRANPLVVEDLDILFVVDVSRSMDVNDVAGSRLDRAQSALKLFSQNLAGQRVGIVAFAQKAFYYCPLTADYGSFHGFVDALSPAIIPYQGTELQGVWELVEDVINNNKATAKVIVFLSDGEFHTSIPTSSFQNATGGKVPAYVLGIGTEGGGMVHAWVRQGTQAVRRPLLLNDEKVRSSLDEAKLRELADSIGGSYFNISQDFQSLVKVGKSLEETRRRLLKEGGASQLRSRIYVFAILPLLAWVGALVLAMFRRRPEVAHA